MKNLVGYGTYNGCGSYGASSTCGCGGTSCGTSGCGCAGHNGMGATDDGKIAGLTPFAWVLVAASAGVLAYLIGQKD